MTLDFSYRPDANGNGHYHAPEPLLEALEPDPIREAQLERIDAWFERGLRLLAQYDGNRSLALDCFIFALGRGEIIGCLTETEISRKHFGSTARKATVSKIVAMFNAVLRLDGMPGQRGENGKRRMAEARRGQLK